jgi:type I restriction enzyme S subunit
MVNKKPTGKTFRYIDINSIDNKRHIIIEARCLNVSDAPSRASRGVNVGDTLFSMVRPYLENIAYIDKNYENCIASTGFFVCKPTQILFSKYLYFLMLSSYVIDGLNSFMKGDNSPSINNDNITSFLYPIPPLAEQHRIVSAIESIFALIDEIESNKLSLSQFIKQTKSKVLDLAIRGKLVPQNPNDEPAAVLLERIGNEQKGKKVTADILHYSNLPNGWAECELGELLEYEQPTNYIVSSTDYSDEYQIPVLTAGKSFIIGYTNEDFGICKAFPVIIFDDFTTESKYVDFHFKVKSSAMKILSTKEDVADIKFLYYTMQTIDISCDTHKRYWISTYSKCIISLPPLSEQKRLVSKIEHIFAQLDKIEKTMKS